MRQKNNLSDKGQAVGEYRLIEQTSGEGTQKMCKYTAVYKDKEIALGEYKSLSGCHTTQSVVSNGMLAIASDIYTFFYDPVQDKVLTLDPQKLTGFLDYPSSNDLNLTDYPNRRYFLNGASWQVWYQKKLNENGQSPDKPIIFTTADAGNTFIFDSKIQQ